MIGRITPRFNPSLKSPLPTEAVGTAFLAMTKTKVEALPAGAIQALIAAGIITADLRHGVLD